MVESVSSVFDFSCLCHNNQMKKQIDWWIIWFPEEKNQRSLGGRSIKIILELHPKHFSGRRGEVVDLLSPFSLDCSDFEFDENGLEIDSFPSFITSSRWSLDQSILSRWRILVEKWCVTVFPIEPSCGFKWTKFASITAVLCSCLSNRIARKIFDAVHSFGRPTRAPRDGMGQKNFDDSGTGRDGTKAIFSL